MQFGLIVPSSVAPGERPDVAMGETAELVRLAREAGFRSLWAGQGWLVNQWHPTLLLARMAAEAPGLTMGALLLLSMHHPVELAEQASTLDALCGGKLTLGLSLGWRPFQFQAFGVPKGERLSRFLEALEVLKLLWTRRRVTFLGTHFHLEDVPGALPPVQQPHPPLLIGANNDPGVKRAAHLADGWLVSTRSIFSTVKRHAQLYWAALKEQGRQGQIVAWREAYCAPDHSTARDTIRPYVEGLYRDRAALGHSQELPTADRIDVPFEEVLAGRFILGSPQECIEEVHRYQELGIQELVLRMHWPGMPRRESLRSLELLGSRVLPAFR
ncbi:MAG: LLM class flavin-dependent oxidoreductase [Chloroflexi bacterium]|nr:LLM class flavin-dependent oxidoreductase [Chloroflexota bacterium]